MNEFHQGHISFVGPAGCGKTTLMKSIARDVLDGKFTARELLFHDDDSLSEKEAKEAVALTKSHPERVLFLIDSLDTLPYTLDGVYKIIGVDEIACPEAILWSLFSGKLFPGCRIITSSREYSIRNYKGKIRPHKVIVLAGLTKASIMEIIVGYVGQEEAEKIMEHLKTRCPGQLSLCSNPAALVYTLIGIKSRHSFKPTTMTGILIVVLQDIIRSPHTLRENILEIFEKFQTLAYNGIKEGKVIFTTEELSKVGLKPEDTSDLAILVPGQAGPKEVEKSSQSSFVHYFSHLSLQELFAALFIAKMEGGEFADFVDSDLHSPRYAVIRSFLCGILLDDEVTKASQGLLEGDSNFGTKRSMVKDSFRSLINRSLGSPGSHDCPEVLRLLVSLHESKQGMVDIVVSSLREIIIHDIPLSAGDAYAVGSVAGNCEKLTEVNFRNCSINPYLLQTIDQALEGSQVQVEKFALARNTSIDVKGLEIVGSISSKWKANVLYVSDCDLGPGHVKALQSTLRNKKMKALSFSYNKDMGVAGLSAVGQIVFETRTDDLYLRQCELKADELTALLSSLNGSQMKLLNLESNINMGVEGCAAVGKIVSECGVERLSMWKCQLNAKYVHALVDSVEGNSLHEFDLNENPDMGVDGLKSLGRLAIKSGLKILSLQRCKLSAACLRALRMSLGKTQLLKLSIAEKKGATREDIEEVLGLLHNVTGKLHLNFWEIDSESRKLIQAELDTLGDKAPVVTTNYGSLSRCEDLPSTSLVES